MATRRISDYLQSHRFWVADISPSALPPFTVFFPTFAFQTFSGVNLSVEYEQVRSNNSMFSKYVPSSATVDEITMTRGARIEDGDFYRWIDRAIRGTDFFRRDLLVVQFTGKSYTDADSASSRGFQQFVKGVTGQSNVVPYIPGRAWILWGCVPVRYTSGSLEATSGEVTIMELAVQPQHVTEVALGAPV